MMMKSSRVGMAALVMVIGAAGASVAQQPLTLKEAVAMAQKQGMLARAAVATRDAARARDRSFGARLMPQLTLSGTAPSYDRSIIPVIQPDGSTLYTPLQQTRSTAAMTLSQRLPFTGGLLGITSQLDRLQISGAQSRQTWSSTPVSVSLSQGIMRPNTVKWDTREQDIGADLAERTYLEAREDIAAQTTSSFFDYYSAKIGLANAQANALVNDTLYTLNKGRFEVGKIGENDLLQSQLALLRSRASLDGAKLEFDRAAAALRLALNLPNGSAIEIAVPSSIPAIDADTAIAVVQALANRASQLDLDLQRVRADRAINAARLNNGLGATINGSVGFNQTSPEVNGVYKDLLQAQRFSLGVQIPIAQWGARTSDIEAAKADRERVESSARATREQTMQDAHFGALQLTQARRNVEISATADTVAQKRYEVAYNRYVIGKIGMDNLYLAQTEKDGAVQQYVSALRSYWAAYYRLRKVTLYDFEVGAPIH